MQYTTIALHYQVSLQIYLFFENQKSIVSFNIESFSSGSTIFTIKSTYQFPTFAFMNYLSVESLSKSYNEKQLFDGITFGLQQGQKAALVGVNGCGKSTLLKIIAGAEKQDKGEVSFRKGLRVAFLAQNPHFHPSDTILEAVFNEDFEELNLIRDYEAAVLKAQLNPDQAEDLSLLIEKIDRLNAWEYEHQVKELLGKLGLNDLDQKIAELSGGQKKRVALAQTLVVKPDFLIMDEPTNHLDIEVIEWLENYLATQNLTLLMVTHDRYFLDRVTNEIIELEDGKLFEYTGNYSQFLEKKAERKANEAATVDKAKNLMRKELDWMRRQPKARGTKAKYRVEAFHDLKDKAAQKVGQDSIDINLTGDRQGKKILELHHIRHSFDEKIILEDFNYTFKRKDRVGLVGPNGVGKSTFLNIITGDLKPDSGKLEIGQTTNFGYYTQEEEVFDDSKKVIEIITDVAEVIKMSDGSVITASQLLGQFLFPPKVQHQYVGNLSGGEKRRLQLLRVLMQNPNFLIFDEPTNDLDIMTLNVLEDYLDKFEGCLLIVSHDRYFMDRLVDHLFVMEGKGKVRDFPGNYTDYRESYGLPGAKAEENKKKEVKNLEKSKPDKSSAQKLSFNEKRELEQLNKEIPELEDRKKKLNELLNSESDYQKLHDLGKELEELSQKIEEKEMRWLELSERD